jgi:hypothetical protein
LTRTSIRLWFCLAVAVVAAAIADPLIEGASNAGFFGRGNFTDHSNADVVPALIAGACLAAAFLALRVRALLTSGTPQSGFLRASDEALRGGIARLLPAAFTLQIATLFAMETLEQYAVYGHGLGGTLWVGGPVLMGLAIHAALCALVFIAAARSIHSLAAATACVIRRVLALAAFPLHGSRPIAIRRREAVSLARSRPVLCRIGERAPPSLLQA